MTILGIQLGHNATAALLVDGRIVGAVSQEKFDNKKNSSAFPREAIEWLLTEFNVEWVDRIAIAGIHVYPAQLAALTSSGVGAGRSVRSVVKRVADATFARVHHLSFVRNLYWNRLMRNSRRASQNARPVLIELLAPYVIGRRIEFVEHHVCHAYASYYALSRDHEERALIMTLDGSGDRYAATVNLYENGEIRRIASTRWIHSLGYVYSFITKFLGMTPLEHEYKVMGLAPYAKEKYVRGLYERVFKPLIWLKSSNPLEFDSRIPTNRSMGYFRRMLTGERFDNVSGAVQMLTEDLVTRWVRAAAQKLKAGVLYTGGGVFMNVKANMRVGEISEITAPHFMPSCGDESNPFGAAYYVYRNETGSHPHPLHDLYLGPRYTNEEVETFIVKQGLRDRFSVARHDDIETVIAGLLTGFTAVARFKGRAEWGARSLGNRSILANPSDLTSFYEVNDAIKQRDFWMPFAPSILDTDADRYLVNPKHIEAPYMILGFNTTPLAREHLRAAMHQADKTVRPQVVTKDANADYWHLIDAFKQKTGIGAVMNTSFNLHGYPLVATLEQALFTFENSGLKHLAIENFLITKK